MGDQLVLPAIAAAALAWGLLCALLQGRCERSDTPKYVWREASAAGWSDWSDLQWVSPSADYAAILRAVRDQAHPEAVAVQFASVVAPSDAPEFTLRVLFMSAVREPSHDFAPATGP